MEHLPPQPLIAVPAYLLVATFEPFRPVGLGFAAGAMLWLAVRELLPDALRESRPRAVLGAASAAAAAMIALQIALL